MAKPSPETIASQARQRISRIRDALAEIDYLCSGTLLKSLMTCGKPSCRCHQDPAARHGPYYRSDTSYRWRRYFLSTQPLLRDVLGSEFESAKQINN